MEALSKGKSSDTSGKGGSTINNTTNSGGRRLALQLQNLTGTADVGCRLDLRKLAMAARNAEYNPGRFSGVVMRLRDPRSTALIFGSGKMIITGVKTEEYCKISAKKYCKIIQKVMTEATIRFKDFKIQNMVATSEVGFPIRLEGLAYAHARFASYEPVDGRAGIIICSRLSPETGFLALPFKGHFIESKTAK